MRPLAIWIRVKFALIGLAGQLVLDVSRVASFAESLPADSPKVFYLDSVAGNDANDGCSQATAWRLLDKVNSSAVPPGSIVLFRRGGVWRGQIIPRSGTAEHRTYYGAWGSGAKPVILGSVSMKRDTDWLDEGGDVWKSRAAFDTDVGNLIFDGARVFGFKRWSRGDLKAQGQYFYDRVTKHLSLYSTANPGVMYKDIEAGLRQNIVNWDNTSFVTFENLSIKFGAAHGFGGTNTAFLTVRGCDISYIGGGDLFMDGRNVRYGNGVEFWANAHDCLVEKCRIWEMYDTALTNQNTFEDARQYNIMYRNNVVWNCAYGSFECWSTPVSSSMMSIRFEHNTCVGAGGGWGRPPQRPDPSGYQLVLDQCAVANPTAIGPRVIIRDNIFYLSDCALLIRRTSTWDAAMIDYNCWFQPEGRMVDIEEAGRTFTMAEFAAYKTFSRLDAHSLADDPRFVDPSANDYRLRAGSPCLGAGWGEKTEGGRGGTSPPAGGVSDIGAQED